MYSAFVVIIVLASIFLTIAVLLQNSKGGGLASNFAAGNQTFGVRETASFLEKATWVLAAVVIIVSIAASATISGSSNTRKSDLTKELQKSAPSNNVPTFPLSTTPENTPQDATPAE